jgi:predicted RNA methylase
MIDGEGSVNMVTNMVTLNKFYTKAETIKICYNAIKKYLKVKKQDLVIEPSAGNGSFINIIKALTDNYIFYDIKPEHSDVIKANFLKTVLNIFDFKYRKIHIIGNPPFGYKSSMAIKFIKHSANILKADSISFILPISFRKPSFQKSFPLNYHLIYEIILPTNSFTYFGETKKIKTVFQIWKRKNINRISPSKLAPSAWYKFVKKENSDISIRRVGSNAGFAKLRSDNDNINTHWFIKVNNIDNYQKLLLKLNKIIYNKTNNVGAISISKQDIIRNYNKIR